MTEGQRQRIASLQSWPGTVDVFDVPEGSVFVVQRNTRGLTTWVEVMEPEPSLRQAWDTGEPRE